MSLPNPSFEGYVPRTDQNIVTSTIYNLRVTIEGREGKKGKKGKSFHFVQIGRLLLSNPDCLS